MLNRLTTILTISLIVSFFFLGCKGSENPVGTTPLHPKGTYIANIPPSVFKLDLKNDGTCAYTNTVNGISSTASGTYTYTATSVTCIINQVGTIPFDRKGNDLQYGSGAHAILYKKQ